MRLSKPRRQPPTSKNFSTKIVSDPNFIKQIIQEEDEKAEEKEL